MTENEINRILNLDVLAEQAPLGRNFLIESTHGSHNVYERQLRVRKFNQNKKRYIQESNLDLTLPSAKSLELPDDSVEFDDSLIENLINRKSTRTFSGKAIPLQKLSFLLNLASGYKTKKKTNRDVRSRFFPSGGGLYTTRIYVDVLNIEGFQQGLYRYNPETSQLDVLCQEFTEDDRNSLYNSNVSLNSETRPSFIIIISTRPHVAVTKYGEHAWKVILMEIGHVAQNFLLIGQGLDLASYLQSSLNPAVVPKVFGVSNRTEFFLQTIVFG